MTIPFGRLSAAYSPRRLHTRARHILTSSTQSGPRPTRRSGHNLGLRYQWLESSVRSTAREVAILEEATDSSRSFDQRGSLFISNGFRVPREKVEVFHGLDIPREPKPPEPDECCMSGCAVCVYDLYEDSLLAYKTSLASLRTQLRSMGIPQPEWPPRIKSPPTSSAVQRPSDTSLDAFEAMEKTLRAKQRGRVEGDESAPKTHPLQFQLIPLLYEGMKWVVFSNR